MLSEQQIEVLGDGITGLYQELEQEVISDIARRVKKTGRYTETAELMAKSMAEYGYSPNKIRSEVMKTLRADTAYQKMVEDNTIEYKQYVNSLINETTARAKEVGNDLVAQAGNMAYNNDLELWESNGKVLNRPQDLGQLVKSMQEQTAGQLANLTLTTGFKGVSGFTAIQNAYVRQMDLATIKLSSGAYSMEQCVQDCVKELAQSGLRSINYESGRTMQLDTAVRNCLRTSSSQLAGKISMSNLINNGEDLVEVDSHWGARNGDGQADHAGWQGKIYSISGKHTKYKKLEDVTGYPNNPAGLCGYNCRHSFYIFFEGISEPNKWEPEPAPTTYNGKSYTYTEATQKQRQMERNIRATKREIEATRALGDDTTYLNARLKKQTTDYKVFSASANIKTKPNRLVVNSYNKA